MDIITIMTMIMIGSVGPTRMSNIRGNNDMIIKVDYHLCLFIRKK